MEYYFLVGFILFFWYRVFGLLRLFFDFDIGLYNVVLVSKGFRSDECFV